MSIELVMLSNHLILCCPLSFYLQLFPTSESFPIHRLFVSGGQGIGASALASILLMNIQGWFPLALTDPLAVQGTLKSLLQHHNSEASVLQCWSLLYGPTLTSVPDYWKNHSFDWADLCWQSDPFQSSDKSSLIDYASLYLKNISLTSSITIFLGFSLFQWLL